MPSAGLPEESSPRAARILTAAGELLLGRGARGVTVAEVAERAHVGKGTVYLYWPSKEDLVLGLIVRDLVAHAHEFTEALTTDAVVALPSRMVAMLVRTLPSHPFAQALQSHDTALLGALADDRRANRLLDILGPTALLHALLPVWRSHGLADQDRPVADQVYSLHVIVSGVLGTTPSRRAPAPASAPLDVLAAMTTALLGPERADGDQLRATASECREIFGRAASAALDLIQNTN